MLWILNAEPIWTVLQPAPFSGITLTLTVPLLGTGLSEPSWTVLQSSVFWDNFDADGTVVGC